MSDMLQSTIVAYNFVEKSHRFLKEFLKEKSQDTKDATHYPTLRTNLLLTTSRQNPRNTLPHATRTNFLSVEFSLTMLSVH
jgi:hypothetical protein